MAQKRILTGIKPTGAPHIGNYFGALKPAIDMMSAPNQDGFLFVADFHALNLAKERENLAQNSLEMAASLLAMGLDPKKVTFYRQSDVPEIFELTAIITPFTPKGLMNRAHAYKASVQENRANGCTPEDEDIGINMGLYNYPILMTADILSFDIDMVPIGRDQRQHLEFARDIAASINSFYKADLLKQPDSFFAEEVEELPGLDGRKMSKSYGNTIPVFAEASEVLKACKRITTDSRTPDEPKDKESLIYKLYKAYATASELADFEQRFLGGGMGYGAAKQEIADLHEARFAKGREEYKRLVADPAYVKSILQEGAAKARPLAQATLKRVREKMGFY
jgi:tryptophanyl-tRNA synthetase